MKFYSSFLFMFFFIEVVLIIIQLCSADCDNLQDTCPSPSPPFNQTIFINGIPCKNPSNTVDQDFKTNQLSKAGSRDDFGSSMNIVTASNFPGLNTLGLSIGRIDIEVDGIVNFHNHQRATEMIFVKEGVLEAAFLDTKNQLFQKSLKAGDVFVFPKGLFHFLLNRGSGVATLFSVFNSQNPGLGSLRAVPSAGTTLESVEKLKRKIFSISHSELDGVTLPLPVLETIYS